MRKWGDRMKKMQDRNEKTNNRINGLPAVTDDLNCGKLTKLIKARYSMVGCDIRCRIFDWGDIHHFLKPNGKLA